MPIFRATDYAPGDVRLRVLIVTESFLPQVNGVTNSVCRILEDLTRRGHTAEVVAPTGPDFYAGAVIHQVGGIDLPGYDGFTLGVATRRQIRNIMADFRPDVVHVASPFLLGYAAVRAANSLQIPVVSIYQTDMVGFARRYRMRATEAVIKHRLRRIHIQSDLNLAPSTASMDQLENLGIPRLRWWPRGIDTDLFTAEKRNEPLHADLTGAAAGSDSASHKVLIGYVGRLAKEKNLHHLSRLQTIPGVRLVVVGQGPERESLQRLLPDALFLGELHGEQLAALMATLDIFVHPGAEETFCQAVQEALASGVPAVGPASGGLKDRIGHGVNGLQYTTGDVEDMRAKVQRLTTDHSLRKQLGAAASEGVQDRSWSMVTELLITHYLDAVTACDPHTRPTAPHTAQMTRGLRNVGV